MWNVLLFLLENKHKSDLRKKENKSLKESILSVCTTTKVKNKWNSTHTRKTMWKRRKYLICLVILYLWLIETVEGKVDICSSLCRCVNESLFVKIHCDFIDNKVSHCEIFASYREMSRVYSTHGLSHSSNLPPPTHTLFFDSCSPHILNCFVYLLTFSITLKCNWIVHRGNFFHADMRSLNWIIIFDWINVYWFKWHKKRCIGGRAIKMNFEFENLIKI